MEINNFAENNKWIVYFTNYSELCRQYNENILENNWEEHYKQLLRKKEDDVIGW